VSATATILFVGDLVGGAGRRTLLGLLPALRDRYAPTFVVVNGENAAGGLGITPAIADELLAAGVDVITLGNHAYHRREILPYLDREPRLLRPHNYLRSHPGRGVAIAERDGVRLGVVNLAGNVFLHGGRPVFAEADAVLAQLEERADHVLVDFHAEATSEKVGMGWHLDGRVTAVVGTHTHVPTADARVLPGGTAFITDVGMTGDYDSVIGMAKAEPLQRFVRRISSGKFEPALGPASLCAVAVETDDATGLATRIAPVRLGGRLEEARPAFWD
jgi:metallophosphoesterase (TIGR00282 family)